MSAETNEYLGCRVGEFSLGIDTRFVGEVFETPLITRLPNSPGFLLGLINVRGNVVPVLDLWGLAALGAGVRRVVVLKTKEGLVGLLVTHWVDLMRFSSVDEAPRLPSALEPYKAFFTTSGLSGERYYLARVEELVEYASGLRAA